MLVYSPMIGIDVETIVRLAVWATLFIGYFGLTSFVLVKREITYTNRPMVFLGVTIAAVVGSFLLWQRWFSPVVHRVPQLLFLLLGEIVMLQLLGVMLYIIYRRNPILRANMDKPMHGMQINNHYLYTKAAEILYQQMYIFLMVLFVQQWAAGLSGQIALGAIIFGVSHIPILLVMVDKRNALIIIAGATVFGALVALFYNILGYYGLLVGYSVHYGVYLLAPLGYLLAKKVGISLSLEKKTSLLGM